MNELDVAVQNCKVALVRYRLCTSGRTVRDEQEKKQKSAWTEMKRKHTIVNKNIRY